MAAWWGAAGNGCNQRRADSWQWAGWQQRGEEDESQWGTWGPDSSNDTSGWWNEWTWSERGEGPSQEWKANDWKWTEQENTTDYVAAEPLVVEAAPSGTAPEPEAVSDVKVAPLKGSVARTAIKAKAKRLTPMPPKTPPPKELLEKKQHKSPKVVLPMYHDTAMEPESPSVMSPSKRKQLHPEDSEKVAAPKSAAGWKAKAKASTPLDTPQEIFAYGAAAAAGGVFIPKRLMEVQQ